MTVDGVLGRVATGLATTALLGLGVHLFGGEPHRQPAEHGAYAGIPDNLAVDAEAVVGLGDQPPAVGLTNAVAAPDAAVPLPLTEPFTAGQAPVAGESFESVVASLGTQVTNSLGPTFMNAGIVLPFALAPKILDQVTPMLDDPVVDALPVEALPADALPAF